MDLSMCSLCVFIPIIADSSTVLLYCSNSTTDAAMQLTCQFFTFVGEHQIRVSVHFNWSILMTACEFLKVSQFQHCNSRENLIRNAGNLTLTQ